MGEYERMVQKRENQVRMTCGRCGETQIEVVVDDFHGPSIECEKCGRREDGSDWLSILARWNHQPLVDRVEELEERLQRARDVADGLVEAYKCPLQQKVKEAFKAYDAERDSR